MIMLTSTNGKTISINPDSIRKISRLRGAINSVIKTHNKIFIVRENVKQIKRLIKNEYSDRSLSLFD